MIDDCAINSFHAPIDGIHFDFQKMDDKVKDRLVLSVDWSWETLRAV
jgi:hypothetical protein